MGIRISLKNTYNSYLVITFLISLLITSICLILLISTNMPYDACIKVFGWIGNSLLIWGLYVFKKLNRTNLNQYSIFYLSYFVFSFGQLMLFSVGIEYARYNVLRLFPQDDIIKYCVFFCISTCFFLFGALLAIKKDIRYREQFKEILKSSNALLSATKVVAWALFIISAPVYFADLINNTILSITQGYGAIYNVSDSDSVSNIVSSLSMWCVPSLYLLLWSYKHSMFARVSITLLIVTSIIGTLIVGGRSGAVAMLLSYIFLWNAIIKKINKRKMFVMLIGLFLFFSILPIIQNYRGVTGKSIEDFWNMLAIMYDGNKIFEIIGEMGGSMAVLLRVFNLVPSIYPLHWGESYLASILAVIPSLFLGGYSFTDKAQLAGWLQHAANMSYGPGFSMHGEAYYNFGWLGIPFMLVVGWVFYKFLSNDMIKGKLFVLRDTFAAIALYAFITTTRDAMYLTIRKELYMILVPLFMIIIINNQLKSSEQKNLKNHDSNSISNFS